MTKWMTCAVLLCGFVTVARAEDKPRTADEASIRTVLSSIGTTWNAHDEPGVSARYTDEITLVSSVSGRVFRDKPAVVRIFHREHIGEKAIMKGTTWTGGLLSLRFLGANWALADIDCNIANVKGPDGAALPGRHVLIVVPNKRTGKWLITDLRPMFTNGAPPALEGTPLRP